MQQSSNLPSARLFWRLALIASLLTFGLIVLGAVVRVTDSGLGCGNDWPLCNGTIFPPLDNLTAWIEWSHRLFAMLIGLFGLGMLAVALRAYRVEKRVVLIVTVVAAVLYTAQSGLGRSVVKADLAPELVAIHLGTAMLLLAALLSAAVLAKYIPEVTYPRDQVTTLIYINVVTAYVIILTGALVRGSSPDTLACVDWPLCNGELQPFQQGITQTIHMIHRFAVVAFGIMLLLLVWQVFQARSHPLIRQLAGLALLAYLAQVAVGAVFVFSRAGSGWGALHVALAATTWALLVALTVIETVNSRAVNRANVEQQPVKTAV
jgi:heme A synthase